MKISHYRSHSISIMKKSKFKQFKIDKLYILKTNKKDYIEQLGNVKKLVTEKVSFNIELTNI